jgi:hypothetical protein
MRFGYNRRLVGPMTPIGMTGYSAEQALESRPSATFPSSRPAHQRHIGAPQRAIHLYVANVISLPFVLHQPSKRV